MAKVKKKVLFAFRLCGDNENSDFFLRALSQNDTKVEFGARIWGDRKVGKDKFSSESFSAHVAQQQFPTLRKENKLPVCGNTWSTWGGWGAGGEWKAHCNLTKKNRFFLFFEETFFCCCFIYTHVQSLSLTLL